MIKVCCFIGHEYEKLIYCYEKRLEELIEKLITEENVYIFIFSNCGLFSDTCYEIVTKLKEKYPDIKRYFIEDDKYYNLLKEDILDSKFEKHFCPEYVEDSGIYAGKRRMQFAVKKSDFCVFFYIKEYCRFRPDDTETVWVYASRKYGKTRLNIVNKNCLEIKPASK